VRLISGNAAWHLFFDSLWKDFDSRFNNILERLTRHKNQVTNEAIAIDLVESRQWRAKVQEDLENKEKQRTKTHVHDTMAWLNVTAEDQDNILDQLLSKRLAGTCEWIFRSPKMGSWRDDAHGEPLLWVKGIPGAGILLIFQTLISFQTESLH
jgi:hypothetical protein